MLIRAFRLNAGMAGVAESPPPDDADSGGKTRSWRNIKICRPRGAARRFVRFCRNFAPKMAIPPKTAAACG